jgi:hypothetical protein
MSASLRLAVYVRDLRVLKLAGEVQPHGARLIVALAMGSIRHRADWGVEMRVRYETRGAEPVEMLDAGVGAGGDVVAAFGAGGDGGVDLAAAGIQPADLAQQTVKDGLAIDFNHASEGVIGHGIVVVERGQHAQFDPMYRYCPHCRRVRLPFLIVDFLTVSTPRLARGARRGAPATQQVYSIIMGSGSFPVDRTYFLFWRSRLVRRSDGVGARPVGAGV